MLFGVGANLARTYPLICCASAAHLKIPIKTLKPGRSDPGYDVVLVWPTY